MAERSSETSTFPFPAKRFSYSPTLRQTTRRHIPHSNSDVVATTAPPSSPLRMGRAAARASAARQPHLSSPASDVTLRLQHAQTRSVFSLPCFPLRVLQ